MSHVRTAEFETSAADPGGWPPESVPETGPESLPGASGDEAGSLIDEIAFVGRSNVGKSSLLNALAERRGLARTSAAPGRTRLVNFFRVEVQHGAATRRLRFVDLPGFGYAKVSKSERSTWRPTIERYLSERRSLRVVALLVDARRVPGQTSSRDERDALLDERELAAWLAQPNPERPVTVVPVLTKVDKLAKHELKLTAERLRRLLGAPPVAFSALTGEGRERLWERLLRALPSAAAPSSPDDATPADEV